MSSVAPRPSPLPCVLPSLPVSSLPLPRTQTQMGVDYTTFRDRLKAGEWELADNEHRRLMTVLAGEDAEDREWVYFTEVQNMPVTDMKTIDALWRYYSDGKFGFSVQRKIWIGKKRQWPKFFKAIDWTTGENGTYRKWPEEFIWEKDAAKGHMPLTSALRGTQLLNALLAGDAKDTGDTLNEEERATARDFGICFDGDSLHFFHFFPSLSHHLAAPSLCIP